MIIESDGAVIEVGPAGDLHRIRHHSSASAVVERIGSRIELDGDHHAPVRKSDHDLDEVRQHDTLGEIELDVRHSFAVGWTTRLVVANTGPVAVVAGASLLLEPAPLVTGWRLCAGAGGVLALLDPTGPLLIGRVVSGAADEITGTGLRLVPAALAAGERRVLVVRWDWVGSAATLRRELPRQLPRLAVARAGELIELPSDPDAAVVLPPAIRVLEELDGVQLLEGAGGHQVELRSARGTTAIDLGWAEPEDELLDRAAGELLRAPRTGAGVPRLDGVAAALVLQARLSRLGDDEAGIADEMLTRFTDRLLEADPAPVTAGVSAASLRCCYLAAEVHRHGAVEAFDPDQLLDRAAEELASVIDAARAARELARGAGIAAMRLGVAQLMIGRSATAPATVGALTVELDPDSAWAAAWWEARLATSGPAGLEPRSVAHLRGLGRRLGAGLPGRGVALPDEAARAHAVAVLRLVPEELALELAADWGSPPTVVAEQAAAWLGLELGGSPLAEAHVWLSLVRPPD